MRRREFIAGLGAGTLAWPLAARAQQAGKLPIIGYLHRGTGMSTPVGGPAFLRRLADLGWSEGRTVTIEYGWAEGRDDRVAEFAAEFVRLKVDVIVTSGDAVPAIKQVTTAIPIVFAIASYPVAT